MIKRVPERPAARKNDLFISNKTNFASSLRRVVALFRDSEFCVCVYVHVCLCLCVSECIHIHIYMYVCVCVCVCVHSCVHPLICVCEYLCVSL